MANMSELVFSGCLYFHMVVAHNGSLLMCTQQLQKWLACLQTLYFSVVFLLLGFILVL
jgi:hypothetical protein